MYYVLCIICIMEGQDELTLRKSDTMECGLEDDNKAILDFR